jgi:hypothetical protein
VNATDITKIETHLKIKLPKDCSRFLLSLPSHEFFTCWEKEPAFYAEVFSDPEWMIVQNLQLRQAGPLFGGKPWPTTYLAVGSDGCGNTYCIDTAAKRGDAVLMFDHDPKNAFIEVAPSWSKFTADWRRIPSKNAEETKAEKRTLIITRAPIPWKGVLHPISLEEWTAYVSSDPEMQLLGYREMANPFTGEVTRVDSPGYAVWKKPTKAKTAAVHKFGCITMEGESSGRVKTMKQIAKALDANVMDELGNKY